MSQRRPITTALVLALVLSNHVWAGVACCCVPRRGATPESQPPQLTCCSASSSASSSASCATSSSPISASRHQASVAAEHSNFERGAAAFPFRSGTLTTCGRAAIDPEQQGKRECCCDTAGATVLLPEAANSFPLDLNAWPGDDSARLVIADGRASTDQPQSRPLFARSLRVLYCSWLK